jgi:threonine dehydrogenase-like Zn-dependent dehydrogenase
MKRCAICGTDLGKDLFSAVTAEPCCSICKFKFIGGLPTSDERIALARARLGLEDGTYFQQDNGAEAARILGRRR